MYLEDMMSVSVNLAGLPGLAIPAGETEDGLALGLQLVGPRRSDADLLKFAAEMDNDSRAGSTETHADILEVKINVLVGVVSGNCDCCGWVARAGRDDSLMGKRKHDFNVEEYQTRWLKIENSLVKGQRQSYNLAVLNADKLLDRAFDRTRASGQNHGRANETCR